MKNNFKFYSNTDEGLTSISAQQVDQLISKYNIYFRSYCIPTQEAMSRFFDWDNGQDSNIYQLDNLVSFDIQYKQLKMINFPNDTTLSFYTDYVENKDLVIKRLDLAKEILISKCKSVNFSNLKKETRLKDDVIKVYVAEMEPFKNSNIYDFMG